MLSYLLRSLIDSKLVTKEGLQYALSDYGKHMMPYARKANDASSFPMPCVAVIVRQGEKILIRRKDREPEKGKSIFIGGKMDFGEDLFECCRRKVREKVGIEIRNLKMICINNYLSGSPAVRSHFLVFFVTAEPCGDVDPNPQSAQWLAPHEITGELFPDNRFILDHMLNNQEIKVISSSYDELRDIFEVVNLS